MSAQVDVSGWEVFCSEYDATLYVMPKGMWEGRGGPNTICVIHEGIHDAAAKAEQIAALPELTAKFAELIAADKEYDEATRAWLDPERDDHAALRIRLNKARTRRASALAAVGQQS